MFILKQRRLQQFILSGNRARDSRNWKKAQERFKKYLVLSPSDGPIWVQLGHCLKESGDFAGAEAAYARAEALMPGDADLQLQIGHFNKLAGNRLAAITAYRRCIELDTGNGDAQYELGKLGESLGSAEQTLKDSRLSIDPQRDRAANKQEAAAEPEAVSRSAKVIMALYDNLPTAYPEGEPHLIPKMLHFIFGFEAEGDIPYYGYIAISSALHFNQGWQAFYYTMSEPSGPNWLRIRQRVTLILIEDFDFFGNARLRHYAHKADIVRMIILTGVGGVYLDIDTITRKSFEDLRTSDFVMGVQAAGANSASGLCNAVMMGKPKSAFSLNWLLQYDHFRSRGRDDLWDYHSVKLPAILAAQQPETVTVLDYRAFFYPLWNSIQQALFSETSGQFAEDFQPAYCFHLWHGATGEWLDKIDDDFVRTSASIYADIARQVIGDALPEARRCQNEFRPGRSVTRDPGKPLSSSPVWIGK